MLEGILAMYSVPSHPMYREFGTGLIPIDSLKAAGAIAERKSIPGWLTILTRSGDLDSALKLSNMLIAKFGRSTTYAVMALLDNDICSKCNGTGVYKWKSGNVRECKVCDKSGKRQYDIGELSAKFNVPENTIRNALHYVLAEESDAEAEIRAFLSRERSAIS